MEPDSLITSHRHRPSPDNRRVGSCIIRFVACSAFTRCYGLQTRQVALCDPLHRRLRRLRCLHRRSDCYRVERTSSRAGLSPAVVQRLSRRTVISVLASEWSTMTSPPYGLRSTWLRSKALTPDLAEVAALPLSAALRHAAGGLHVPAAFALLRCSSSHCAGVSHMNRNAWLRLRRRSGIRWRGKCTTLTSCSHPIR